MKKIILGILLIAIISVSSATFAVLSDNTNVSNDDATYIAANNIQLKDDVSDSISVPDSIPVAKDVFSNKIEDNTFYIGDYEYSKSQQINDYYIQCVECGGFVAICEVTHNLPDAALCHHFKAELAGLDYQNYAVSYDSAYQYWVDRGCPVFDDGSSLSVLGDPIHLEQADPSQNTPYYGDILAQYEEVAE